MSEVRERVLATLDAPARELLAWLEAAWLRHYRRHGTAKRWQAKTLVERLLTLGACGTHLEARQCLERLWRAGILAAADRGSLTARLGLNPRVGLDANWSETLVEGLPRAAVELGLTPAQSRAWERALDGTLGDWSAPDQAALVAGLRDLAAALPAAYEQGAYAVSARYLLGSSKLLTSLPQELLRAFGIEVTSFRPPVAWVLASGPRAPRGLMLIENPQSFSQACELGIDDQLALICSFGYGLSLGEALSRPERMRLVGERLPGVSLETLLALPNASYWGDMDPEGLRIFRALKRRLPQLNLSALYEPMIMALQAGQGHPLDALTGKPGQLPGQSWQRGLDQEWVEDATLARLAGLPLDARLEAAWLSAIDTNEVRQ
ncbi:Wadjet anti-phage system protein JetD domain-containing protein [Halomonas salifodinae]|uniref:Wadjet anti-phage system protein JetD domain-containing protein n=1 Tax=Halomonas salifodinae TaxID=438745 RepID=A0ABW2F1G6_9GAMM